MKVKGISSKCNTKQQRNPPGNTVKTVTEANNDANVPRSASANAVVFMDSRSTDGVSTAALSQGADVPSLTLHVAPNADPALKSMATLDVLTPGA